MSHDTWIHRVSRFAIVRPLMPTPVTPNQLTTVRLGTGIAAAAMVGAGVTPWEHIGAAVFVVSMVLDRADGDLARLSGQTSAAGHRYDLISDTVSNALILVGLGVGLRDGGYGLLAVPMGLMAGVAVAAILWMIMRIEELKGARGGELPTFAGFDADDAILIIPIGIWLGQSEILLALAAFGAPAFAVFFYWLSRSNLRPPEPD